MPSANDKSLVIKYTKAIPEAYSPSKGSIKAAGYDLKSALDCVVPARDKALVDTGLKIELPEGCYGRIAPRSGLAVKNFIDVGDFDIKSGDRIAQLICEKIYYPDLEEVQALGDTVRGEGGFGST
ncbi:deoxyuridine 5'-triphosphate nucleotidohydrolase-like [Cylas formicarius]|uniref:deoxyuridine 5'-triphosphate nucleotidohydrolase-like n=1 Tax=Cylas formicarius TaxID=197179 RepID=UPI0029586B77|nr:deoxyuridine 5'-triphosphate nucleotidohydrolase-like [Cylas formicarius]